VTTDARRALGRSGEAAAAQWYEERGYQVVARNWRCREGEIDLVLTDGKRLVFCEVKARSSDAFGTPEEAVTPIKQARIRRIAARWLEATPSRGVVRFDVACVRGADVDVLQGAF